MENSNELKIKETLEIRNMIHVIRGQQVMLDSDLAELYGYEVKNLNRQVKRNIERFPEDFMFQLTIDEAKKLPRCQNGTLEMNMRKGKNVKYAPFVFTEQGIYMLATVLKSDIAIQQSIAIMRTFKEVKHFLTNNSFMLEKINVIETNKVNLKTFEKKLTKNSNKSSTIFLNTKNPTKKYSMTVKFMMRSVF